MTTPQDAFSPPSSAAEVTAVQLLADIKRANDLGSPIIRSLIGPAEVAAIQARTVDAMITLAQMVGE